MDYSIRICISKLLGNHEQDSRESLTARDAYAMEKPEKKINWLLILEMFFTNAASSAGTVGFVWATVVLLGGFVTKLNPVDFWFITILSFFQAIRIIGGDWNTEQKIVSDLLTNTDSFKNNGGKRNRKKSKISSCLLLFKDKLASAVADYAPKGLHYSTLLSLGRNLCKNSASIVRLLRFIVPMVWIALSFPHLLLQSFGDIGRSAEDINMKAALNLYYGLAVGQAMLSFIAINYSYSRSKLLEDVAKAYGLNNPEDKSCHKTMDLYYRHVKRICRDEVKSLTSSDQEAQKAGLTILHSLLEAGSFSSKEALLAVRDSPDATESLSNMIASTSDDEMLTRKMAAFVMSRLGIHLRVPEVPFAMRAVCTLLETRDGDQVTPYAAYVKLTNRGLKTLEQLSCNTCNLSVIHSSHELMAKLTGIVHAAALSDSFAFRKANCAVTVFSRLAACTGIQGIDTRHDILENAFLLSNIQEILQCSTTSYLLRERVIEIVDGFALNAASRDCGSTRKLSVMLLGVFCSRDERINEVQVQLAAGRALARLTTESQNNCHAIIRQQGELQAFKSMLSGQHGTFRRVVVANILKNLCAYAKPDSDCQYSMQKFSVDNISMALRTMYQTDNLIGEDMEAFLGLVLQFSKLLCATDFIEAVNGNGIGLRSFIQKLKLILKQANSHRTEANLHPGIRRSAIEQVIWMAQLERELHCIDHFIDCEMRDDLVMAQQTARRAWQENFKLSSGVVPVLEYEESLRSVASRALKLILSEHNAPVIRPSFLPCTSSDHS
uniref:Uncharacterized protein n=1 Tax=Oryza meridionalis TaxID=40149 RepID=A0A0E0EZP8_9ORYZ